MPRSKTREKDYLSMDEDLYYDVDYLHDHIRRLQQRERRAIQKTLTIEMELQRVLGEREKFKRKLGEIKSKIDKLKNNPLPLATVEQVFNHGHEFKAIVKLMTGQMFLCDVEADLNIEVGDTVALHQRSMNILEKVDQYKDREIIGYEIDEKPNISYNDIGGLGKELLEIREVIEFSLNQPELFQKFNIITPKGILLHGPPGTGKTIMAKAVANASNATFFNIEAPSLVQKFIGEGARIIRDIFAHARKTRKPVIIFIDEIDAIASKRTTESQSGEREVNRTLMQLLAEMDGFASNEKIRIIAATNRIDILDPAILRPGRFDRIIKFKLPNLESRIEIFKIHLRNTPLATLNYTKLGQITDGFSGADIKALCTEAKIRALRANIKGEIHNQVTYDDFLTALDEINQEKRHIYGLNQQSHKVEFYT